jgi:hypothetical protein
VTTRAADVLDMTRLREATPPETAMLTREQVAAWLQIGVTAVDRLDLPTIQLGAHTIRYSVRQVLDHLERRAA